MDYKNLVDRLNAYYAEHQRHGGVTAEAATAIETLLAERDDAVDELRAFCTCSTCKNSVQNRMDTAPCQFRLDCNGQYWKWRGPQKGENNDQAKL